LASSKHKTGFSYSDDEMAEMDNINGLHGSYIIPANSSDSDIEYFKELTDKYNGKLFLFDGNDNDLIESIEIFVNKTIELSHGKYTYLNYANTFSSSWKNQINEPNANIPDSDNDDLSDAEEVNWDIFDENNTYADYASQKYTGSEKAKKGLDQLYDNKTISTKKFIPFISDPTTKDTDCDGLADSDELIIETNPRNSDTDSDTLNDGYECTEWYDPLSSNPDSDNYIDDKELTKKTDPFIYNMTPDEWTGDFLEGILKGDAIKDPSIPQLLGTVAGGAIPYVGVFCDVRDTVVNATYDQWGFAALSAIGLVPIIGDASKSSTKIGKFISKNIDKTDEISDLLLAVSKSFPDDFAKLIPNSSLDEIAEAFKKNNTMSRKTYLEIAKIFDKAGAKLYKTSDIFPNAKVVIASEDVWSKGWVIRGDEIDKLLGNDLGKTYKTYDKYISATNTAISIKSIDPMYKSYKSTSYFKGALIRYADKIINGENYVIKNGKTYNDINKGLELAFPDVPLTTEQINVINEFINDYSDKIDITITIVRN
jgi:hypothetical protein